MTDSKRGAGRMADRPGDPDVAVVRRALVYFGGGEPEGFTPGTLAPLAFAALDRLMARLSEAEQLNETLRRALAEAQAFNAEGSRRLSVYEQALRAIVATPYRDWHLNARIARAALTTEPGHPAT